MSERLFLYGFITFCLQVSLLYLLVNWLTQRVIKNRPDLCHWCWSIMMLACLLPPMLHLCSRPIWSISLASLSDASPVDDATPEGRSLSLAESSDVPPPWAEASAQFNARAGNIEKRSISNEKEVMGKPDDPVGVREPSNRSPRARLTEGGVVSTDSNSPSDALVAPVGSAFDLRRVIGMAAAIYLVGVLLMLFRLAIRSTQTIHMMAKSKAIDAHSLAPIEGLSDEITSNELANRVFQHPDVSMPMVLGFFKPKIIVPGQFKNWPPPQKQAALCHELIHIRRRDLQHQALAGGLKVLFWFHPLVWMAAIKLRHWVELATDQAVVALGLNPHDYARALLRIVEQAQNQSIGGSSRFAGQLATQSISMAASDDIQERIESMMGASQLSKRPLAAVAGIFLVAAALASTVGFTGASVKANEPNPEPPAIEQKAVTTPDLLENLRNIPVLSPEVPRSEITVDLSGIVRDSNGNPAPGARVVLLSDTMRYLSQLSRVVPERNELAFLRENLALNEQTTDAIAATYSDDQGRFELKNVQPPEVIRDVIDPFRWAATLLAISNQHELGILNVRSQDRGTVVKNNLYIDLTRTHDLAGRLVDQDGNGLGDKEISVNYITSLTRSASDYRILTGVNQFVLHYRLWPPKVLTDADGAFKLSGLPAQAMLYLSSPGTREHSITAAAVLVGDRSTIQSFGFGPRNAEGIGRVIKQMREAPPNPIVLQAAPGKSVTGRVVSTDGDPIADALVSLPGPMVNRTNADSDGSFVLHVNVDESGNIKGDLIVTADMISKSPRYFPTTVTLKAGGKDESYRDIKIEMPRRIDVSTIIKDSTGRPLQDVTLSFTKADQPYLREIGKSNERGEIRGSVPAEKLQLFLTTPRDDLGLLSFHSLNRNRYLQSESFPPLGRLIYQTTCR